jgi:hypothetical protein
LLTRICFSAEIQFQCVEAAHKAAPHFHSFFWITKMLSYRARSHPKSNKQSTPAFGAHAADGAEVGHPLVGMTKQLILRSTTALGSFSSLVHGCCEKISQAFVFARMAKEMASLTKMCQAPFQNMPSMFGAMLPAPAQPSYTSHSTAQPAAGGFPFWPAIFGMPASTSPSAAALPTAAWQSLPAAMEAAAVMVPAAAFITAFAEAQAQLPKVFAAFFGWA